MPRDYGDWPDYGDLPWCGDRADEADNLASSGYTDPLDYDPLLDDPRMDDPYWGEDLSD